MAAGLYRGGILVALLPAFSLAGEDGARRLLPLGAGTTDWLGPVCAPGITGADLSPLLAALMAAGGASAVDLPALPSGSPLAEIVASPGWRVTCTTGTGCLAVDLPARPGPGLRQTLRTARHRLDRAGPWSIAPVPGAEVADTLPTLFALHAARWRDRGGGVLADDSVQDFHRRAAPVLTAAGLVRFTLLLLRGQPVAALYGVQAKGWFHHYIGGMDPAAAPYSPGTLLIADAMERAAAEGCQVFDFLRGAEAYKSRWGATPRPGLCLTLRREERPRR
jgi:CelD/BcsL family acetyltransferase involved in cellulose biosynthesis